MIGKNISHYRILEKLGEGGMGVVYKAEDTKLKRTVALKFLPPELTKDPEAKERFIQEAQAASALQHNNVSTIHEIDETEDGQIFICMDYYEGESLHEIIERGPLKIDEAIDICTQIADGLHEAHEKGIIHRDIKPANIMITEKGQAKIMDFGLAKLRGQKKLTKEGTTVGTVAYMSPEQARGDEVDHRTDIWSLGVVLFEMITGQTPFKGEYEQSVIYSILNEEPEPLTALRTGIAIELERIVNKCLEKDPAERYQTMAEVLADFRRLKKSIATLEKTPKHQISEPSRSSFFRRIAGIAVLVLIVIVAVVILMRQFSSVEKSSDLKRKMLVVLPFENLGPLEDEYFADGITEEITSRLSSLHGLGVISRTSAIQYKGTQKSARQIGEELDIDYILEGTVRWQHVDEGESRVRITPQLIRVSDDTHIWSDRYDRILQDIFTVQSDIAEQVTQQLDIALSVPEQDKLQARPTENLIAYQAYLRGLDYLNFPHAPKENYRNAQQMFEQAVELDSNFTLAYVKLSDAHRSLYFYGYDHTQERLEKAKKAVDRAIKLQPELSEVHVELGYYYYHGQLEYDRALKELSLAAKTLPNSADLLSDIAYIWRRQGLLEQATANLEQAVKLSPRDPVITTELAYTFMVVRKYEDALLWCDRTHAINQENQWLYLIKASCYWCWHGDLEKAREELEKIPDKSSLSVIWFMFWQKMFERDYEAAIDWPVDFYDEAIEIQSSFTPKLLCEGFVYKLLNDSLRTRSSFEKARILLERVIKEQPEDPRVHSSLGLAYAGLGRKEEAIREGKHAIEIYPVTKDALIGPNRIMDLIHIYVMVEEYDAALDKIEYLLSIPTWYSIPFFSIDPMLDPLPDHPRFQKLIERYSEAES